MRFPGLSARLRGPRAVDLWITLAVQAAVTMPFVVPRAPDLPEATWGAYGLTTAARERARIAPATAMGIVVAAFGPPPAV